MAWGEWCVQERPRFTQSANGTRPGNTRSLLTGLPSNLYTPVPPVFCTNRLKIMAIRVLEIIFFFYFASHIPITLFLDFQALLPGHLFPQPVRARTS